MNGNINDAMTIKLDYELPEYPPFQEGIRRAPRRESHLTQADKELAIKNALRYIHPNHHEQMAKEFAQELEEHGRIYGYRFRPAGKRLRPLSHPTRRSRRRLLFRNLPSRRLRSARWRRRTKNLRIGSRSSRAFPKCSGSIRAGLDSRRASTERRRPYASPCG